MKTLFQFLLLLLLTQTSFAKCLDGAFYFFPNKGTVSQNSIFVIEGYGSMGDLIPELTKKYPVYLQSKNSKIELRPVEFCVGQFQLSQVMLVPAKQLVAGEEYTLRIEKLPKEAKKISRPNEKGHDGAVKWKVTANKDTHKPIWTMIAKEKEKSYQSFGCGPGKHVHFNCEMKDESELLVRTTVQNLKTGATYTYYLPTDGKNISVGHGMCEGAFKFDEADDSKYEVKFTLVDASNNRTEWKGDAIAFVPPLPKDEEK